MKRIIAAFIMMFLYQNNLLAQSTDLDVPAMSASFEDPEFTSVEYTEVMDIEEPIALPEQKPRNKITKAKVTKAKNGRIRIQRDVANIDAE